MKAIRMAMLAVGILAGASGAYAADRDETSINVSPSNEGREQVAFKVNTDGVDFADANSVAAFRRDLGRQINEACNPGDRLKADLSPDFTCRSQMVASAEPAIIKRIIQASGAQYASID